MIRQKIRWKLRYYYLNYFHNNQTNWWLYPAVRHLKRMKKNGETAHYITKIGNPTAGIGDQLASFITGYFYADLLELNYAYSPLYPQSWNDFLGFHEMEADAKILCNEGYQKVRLPYFDHKNQKELLLIKRIIDSYKGKKVIFYIENNQIYGEQYGVSDKLRIKFNAAPARKNDCLIYDKNYINIAVHVRRGDISIGQLNQNPQLIMRWLDNEYYIKVLRQLIKILGNKSIYKIYLFSQGCIEEFQEFNEFENITYCLDMGAQDSFLHLVRADIIITSKSSFSYKPALLSEGLRICPRNFWHGYPNEEKWIVVDEREPELDEGKVQIINKFANSCKNDEICY